MTKKLQSSDMHDKKRDFYVGQQNLLIVFFFYLCTWLPTKPAESIIVLYFCIVSMPDSVETM